MGVIKKATDGAINGLRRRRQLGFLDAVKGAAGAVKGAAGAVGNAAKAAAGKAAAAAKAAGAAAATAGKAFQAAAMKLDGLTGGKLSDALGNTVCPLLAKAIVNWIPIHPTLHSRWYQQWMQVWSQIVLQ